MDGRNGLERTQITENWVCAWCGQDKENPTGLFDVVEMRAVDRDQITSLRVNERMCAINDWQL